MLVAGEPLPMLSNMDADELRSPHVQTSGINYFGRLLDKIRLHSAGRLPADYHANLGAGFDQRCMSFLGVLYADLVARVKQGGNDDDILEWCFEKGRKPSPEEIEIWNDFMRKRGWRDEATPILQRRLREGGFESRSDIQTMFDYIDLDEGREPQGSST